MHNVGVVTFKEPESEYLSIGDLRTSTGNSLSGKIMEVDFLGSITHSCPSDVLVSGTNM